MKQNTTFDLESWIDYFNLFIYQEYSLKYNIVDPDIADVNIDTGKVTAINTGRTTIYVTEEGTDKKAIISLLVTENSTIEPMVETNGSHTVMLKVDGTVWTYGIRWIRGTRKWNEANIR